MSFSVSTGDLVEFICEQPDWTAWGVVIDNYYEPDFEEQIYVIIGPCGEHWLPRTAIVEKKGQDEE